MRWVIGILGLVLATAGQAEPGRMCSDGRYGHAHCIRAGHFSFDLCHTIAAETARHGLDPGFFTRLLWQESRFDPNAISPAGAGGIAQFMPATAAREGLRDRFNPAQSIEISVRYLTYLTQEFGNPGLAAAAYNSGEVRAGQFLAMQRGLPRETINYVEIITGIPAEKWRDAPPDKPDFRLDKDKAFLPACLQLAAKRRITPLKVAPSLPPWGVQVAFGNSPARARQAVDRLRPQCKRLFSDEKIHFVKVKNRVQGKPGYTMARIGRSTRSKADSLCRRLRRAGCVCRVYPN